MSDGLHPSAADRFRAPTAAERRFLELVTEGYDDLAAQLATCEVAAANPAGSLDVRTRGSRTSSRRTSLPGASLELGRGTDGLSAYVETSESGNATIETILRTDAAGRLVGVEIVVFGDAEILDACGLFIAAAQSDPPLLIAASQAR